MIRLLGLALYGPKAASTRYRLGQYVPGLAQHGIDLQIHHLLGDDYLSRRFSGSSISWINLLHAGWSRIGNLWGRDKFDAAILHCELLPLMPGWVERSLLPQPYIYDFDDAFYLKYRSGKLGIMRPLLGEKFDTVIAGAAAVTAGNNILVEYARRLSANTHFLPTVVNTERYMPSPRPHNDTLTIGWIGSPSTAPYLSQLVGPLSLIGKETPVRLVVIGGKAPLIPNISIVEVDWSEQTEIALINSFDVGVMPLPNDDWARGKCAFKLIQYMACAVPVIASRVGANIDVVQSDCGFLAADEHDWVCALRLLRDQSLIRRQMGEAGRQRVDQHYSLRRNLPVLAEVIHQTIKRY
jgi:glycosyltransferase involved in cell wall biosynthesis